MENRRRVTEKDLLITEALIAESYGRLKESVVQAPSRAFRSAGKTISEHPFAAAATAVVGGIAAYEIIKLMTPRVHVEETEGRSRVRMQKDRSRPDLMNKILSMIIPLAAPYITGYIQKYIGRILSGERD